MFIGMERFDNFLIINATDRRKISSNQKRLFIAVSLYPLSFFANTPFNKTCDFALIEIEDGRGAPSKLSIYINIKIFTFNLNFNYCDNNKTAMRA